MFSFIYYLFIFFLINFFYKFFILFKNNGIIFFIFIYFFFIFFFSIKIFRNFVLKKYFFNNIFSFVFINENFLLSESDSFGDFNNNTLIYLLIQISLLLVFGFLYRELINLSFDHVQYYLNAYESYNFYILTGNYEYLIFGVIYNTNINPYLHLFPWLIYFF
jgi:hypothetical protein